MNDLILKQDPLSSLIALNNEATDHYKTQVKTFITWLRENALVVSDDALRGYFSWLNNESGYKARTVAVKRQAVKKRVRQLFKEATLEEKMKVEQVLKDLDHETQTKAPKVNSEEVTRDRVLLQADYLELLTACRTERQRLFIRFLWTTGARVAELVGIRLDDCEETETAVRIRVIGKGRKERILKIDHALFRSIAEQFQGSVYLFETARGRAYARSYVSNQIKKIGQRIGRNISAHTLRHSFATRKVQQLPGKIDAVSRYLGHSSVAITLNMYCHNTLTDEELLEDVG